MERAAIEIPVAEVSEGAIIDAQYVCRTLGWREEAPASRIAQIAELLRRQGRAWLLSEAVRRIGNTQEEGDPVRRHGVYLCATLLDVQLGTCGESGQELARRVLAGTGPPAGKDDGGSPEEQLAAVERGLRALGDAPYRHLFGETGDPQIYAEYDALNRRKLELKRELRWGRRPDGLPGGGRA